MSGTTLNFWTLNFSTLNFLNLSFSNVNQIMAFNPTLKLTRSLTLTQEPNPRPNFRSNRDSYPKTCHYNPKFQASKIKGWKIENKRISGVEKRVKKAWRWTNYGYLILRLKTFKVCGSQPEKNLPLFSRKIFIFLLLK